MVVGGRMNTEVMFSSKTGEWETPQEFFDKLNKEFNFKIDVACTYENKKCNFGFTKECDGLTADWKATLDAYFEGEEPTCWMNPPYGRNINKWIQKAYEESIKGVTTVCLIPSRTDTKYWHTYCMKAYEIRFVKGRLKFGGSKDSAPFPSAVIIFKPDTEQLKVSSY